jgi:hypothetical protein
MHYYFNSFGCFICFSANFGFRGQNRRICLIWWIARPTHDEKEQIIAIYVSHRDLIDQFIYIYSYYLISIFQTVDMATAEASTIDCRCLKLNLTTQWRWYHVIRNFFRPCNLIGQWKHLRVSLKLDGGEHSNNPLYNSILRQLKVCQEVKSKYMKENRVHKGRADGITL